jgi:hypothetical protein
MKYKEKRETFPCRYCITYVICLEKSKEYVISDCSILTDWWKKIKNTIFADQRFYLYEKYFPHGRSKE